MKSNFATVLTGVVLFAALAIPTLLIAQEQPGLPLTQKPHNHYKVVFIGTFGGPNSHFSIGGTRILNDDGSFVGWGDDSLPDPFGLIYGPDACWDDDCFVARAFLWKNGEVADLGSLEPGFSSDVSWMSASGLISGEAQTGEVDLNVGLAMHGILWAHGQMIDLGTLDGGLISLTTSVNDSAEVAGYALTTVPDPYAMFGVNQTRAYRWKDGVMKDLGTLGGPDAMALRINERGQIAGNSYINSDLSDVCGLRTGGFLWARGKMTDLGGFGGTCTTVSDMNNHGQIVGGSLLAGDQAQHGFLWQKGKMIDLGTLGGNFASAVAINEAGDVVGFQTLPETDSIFHAALWKRGTIFDIGALQTGGCSLATSVNSHLQVVGINSSDCSFHDPSLRAIISYSGEPAIDLNTLIPTDSGVELRNASIINERGEIVAVGVYPDGHHGPVLLIPCERKSEQPDACENSGKPLLAARSVLPTFAQTNNRSPQWLHDMVGIAGTSVQNKHYFGPVGWIGKQR
jgi:probable HAF family extracellular repeat protein